MYQKAANLSGEEQLLLESAQGKGSQDWSPDGRFISFISNDPQTGWDLWILPLDGDRKPFVFLKTTFDERRGVFSRDGRWVAYHSNQPGRFETYVRSFPGPGAPQQVSTSGGLYPLWAYGNREIYYLAPDGTLMATPISMVGQNLEVGRPVALFRTRTDGAADVNAGLNYDVSRDGRFLINTVLDDATATLITLIQNWKPPAR